MFNLEVFMHTIKRIVIAVVIATFTMIIIDAIDDVMRFLILSSLTAVYMNAILSIRKITFMKLQG